MTRTWIVQVNQSILGAVVPQARPKGGRFIPAAQLPAPLRQYLNLPDDRKIAPRIQDLTWTDVDTLPLDECLVRRTTRGYGRLLTIVLPASSLPQPHPRVPKGVPAIRSLRQLCDHFGAEEPRELNRRVYKDTGCGASISLLLADRTWLHNGASGWDTLPVTAKILGFTLQTIVEGSEATVDSDTFYLPVAVAEVDAWIADMESEADRLWHEANDDAQEED